MGSPERSSGIALPGGAALPGSGAAAVGKLCVLPGRPDRIRAGAGWDRRLWDLADLADQVDPLLRLEDARDLLRELCVLAEQRGIRDLDPVVVIRQRERRLLALVAHQ